MTNRFYNADTLWLLMMLLSLSTYAVGKLGYSGVEVMAFLLFTTTLKASFIIRDFMGLRGVSLLWRIIMYGWLLIVISSIATAYLLGL